MYLKNGECLACDNTVCGTCVGSATNCIEKCDFDCATCDIYGECLTCDDGEYLNAA